MRSIIVLWDSFLLLFFVLVIVVVVVAVVVVTTASLHCERQRKTDFTYFVRLILNGNFCCQML